MRAIRKKWHELSTNQQILVSIIITIFVLIILPYAIIYLIPLAAIVLLLAVPILVTWCLITLVIGKK
jgi:type IV secretory pathway VirB6-like protein